MFQRFRTLLGTQRNRLKIKKFSFPRSLLLCQNKQLPGTSIGRPVGIVRGEWNYMFYLAENKFYQYFLLIYNRLDRLQSNLVRHY